jgi:dienelactone hydrolase
MVHAFLLTLNYPFYKPFSFTMSRLLRYCFLIFLTGTGLWQTAYSQTKKQAAIRQDDLTFFDTARQRPIPVALYRPSKAAKHPGIVILSHGYQANKAGANKNYSSLAKMLAAEGYYVASIQHELPTDSLIPATGIPQVVRRPHWEKGVANILYVIKELKRTRPDLDYKHLVLIGHSNGGDMSMLFAQKYPGLADKVISLDNRRMAFPRTKQPKLYSLRSSDQPADEGVLPTPEEQQRFGITVIKLPATIHNNMDDSGTPAQLKEINQYILQFLKD